MALGSVDYGLYGVVGGLTIFVSILNSLLATGVGRFYAVSVGRMSVDRTGGLEICRMWFSTAVVLHSVLPFVLVTIGYPCGVWAVKNFLVVPPERIAACLWVWRCACVTCFVSMAGVPFQAMYTAKQEIAELTIYSFVTTTLNAFFFYYIAAHPGVWLVPYAAWMMTAAVVPQLIIAVRACVCFEECHFALAYLKGGWHRVGKLLSYSGWLTFGFLGGMARGQGLAILVNRVFGPVTNAAMTIGTTLSHQSDTFSGSLVGAFSPAIMNAYGAGDLDLMRRMAFRVSKIGTYLLLIFALPLALEAEEVLRIWLKDPPAGTALLCISFLASVVVDKLAVGQMIAVNARGKVALYQMVLGTALIMALPLAAVFVVMGLDLYSIGLSLVASMVVCVLGRVWFARHLVGMSARTWVRGVLLPIAVTAACAGTVGWGVCSLFPASFVRICLTTATVEAVLLPLGWWCVLNGEERNWITFKTKGALAWCVK